MLPKYVTDHLLTDERRNVTVSEYYNNFCIHEFIAFILRIFIKDTYCKPQWISILRNKISF